MSRAKKPTESLRTRAEILNIPLRCGGFHDLESFRREVPEANNIGDEEAHAIILENMNQRINMPIEAKIALDKYDGPKENYVDEELQGYTRFAHNNEIKAREDARNAQRIANEEAQLRARELREERARREREVQEERNKRTYSVRYSLNDPFEFNRLRLYNRDYDTAAYISKERIKQELKEELAEERRRKARQREIDNLWKPKRSPKAKSKSRAKSKKSKSKNTKNATKK